MAEHGSAQAALAALPALAAAAGESDYAPFPTEAAWREIDSGTRRGARLLFLGAPGYPAALAALSDPPPVLWARGCQAVLDRPAVALVGSRNASSLGGRMARKLAEGLGFHGLTVVSGLARGIDTVAHQAALKTGTVAVMAGGVDVIYPAENAPLAAAIADQGALVSEQPIGLQPQARHFPRRNRLIAGLAHAVVVVEAADGSGSLITARDALDQGREVMAVPGHPMDARAAGCNRLIRDGAAGRGGRGRDRRARGQSGRAPARRGRAARRRSGAGAGGDRHAPECRGHADLAPPNPGQARLGPGGRGSTRARSWPAGRHARAGAAVSGT